ncbi:CBO0543 family protein [Salipaludibacillus sp. HK11]|uniref:CBO0543 family protein n=1 Tax=Salipaludibacillus sp. HK11 TaxID=3394320 RepID=UPI0039FCBC15
MNNKMLWVEIIKMRQQTKELEWEYWLSETVFTFNWWFLFLTMIGFIIGWLIVVDKTRIVEIVTFGLFTATTALVLDILGVSYVLWAYPNSIIPVAPSIFEIDEVHLPIIYMVVYQFFTPWKSYLIAITIASFVFAFALEPLLVWLQIYEIYSWEHIYSFPIYVFIGVFFKWLIQKMKQIERKSGKQ